MIAATEPFHVYNEGKGCFWRTGMLLRDQASFENEAMITVSGKELPNIRIEVVGDQPGFFLMEIYRIIDSVLKFWPGVSREYFIACPGADARGEICSFLFRFDAVQHFYYESPDSALDCQVCFKKFKCSDLLLGFKAIRAEEDSNYHIAYMYQRERTPCPRVFLLRPLGVKISDVGSWPNTVGKTYEVSLISEYSGLVVAKKNFKIQSKWLKWLGRFTKYSAVFVSGLSIPLEGTLATDLKAANSTLENLARLPARDGEFNLDSEFASADQVEKRILISEDMLKNVSNFLHEIGLDPETNGLELGYTRDRGWLWMTHAEAKVRAATDARF